MPRVIPFPTGYPELMLQIRPREPAEFLSQPVTAIYSILMNKVETAFESSTERISFPSLATTKNKFSATRLFGVLTTAVSSAI